MSYGFLGSTEFSIIYATGVIYIGGVEKEPRIDGQGRAGYGQGFRPPAIDLTPNTTHTVKKTCTDYALSHCMLPLHISASVGLFVFGSASGAPSPPSGSASSFVPLFALCAALPPWLYGLLEDFRLS